MTELPVTDLAESIMFTDPFPRYAELRRTAPVSRVLYNETRRREGYMLTRYADVMTLHTDPRFSSDPFKQRGSPLTKLMPRMFRLLIDTMVFKDDPEHKRLRGLVNKAFTPKMVQQMADHVQVLADQLLDDLVGAGEVDLVSALAVPLPLSVISNMLGVDDRDREEFQRSVHQMTDVAGAGNVSAMIKMLPAGRRMIRLFERMAEQRRLAPDDRLITALVEANEDDDVLSDHEIIAMIFLLLLAGHDTTSNLIGNSVVTLLDNPEQMQRLRDDPSLIDTAVEELLRFTSPVPCGATRFLLEDVEMAGQTLPRGSQVLGMLISANRDEDIFPAADQLDLGRQPNRHLAFAFGGHFCLGNQLARMEGRMAIRGLLERFEHIELAVPKEQLRWKPTQSLRGLAELPLRLS